MLLVIVVPGLLEAGTSSEGVRAPWPEAPYFARLLKLAGEPRVEPDGLFAALAPLYGVARQRDWPLAPLLVEARGIDPDDAYWLRATPVTLVAGREDVRIAAPAVALDEAEAQALMTRLNQHFAGDGLQFVAPAPNEWFVRLEREPSLSTRPLATVIGKSLRNLLPAGDDAPRWRRWEHEIQMLLHAHPVNEARERSGMAPVNGVWFDQGGRRPPIGANPFIATYGHDQRAAALAQQAGRDAQPLPAFAMMTALRPADERQTNVLFTDGDDPAALDTGIAKPAWDALMRGVLAAVIVAGDGSSGAATVWSASRPDLLGRLLAHRAPPPLARLIASVRATIEAL